MMTNATMLAASDLVSVIIFLVIVVFSMIANAVKKRAESHRTTGEPDEAREFDLGDLLGDWTAPKVPPPPPPVRPAPPKPKTSVKPPVKPPVARPSPKQPRPTAERPPVKPRAPRPAPVARGGVRQVLEVMENALPVVSISSRPSAVDRPVAKTVDAVKLKTPVAPVSRPISRRFDFSRSGLRHAVKLTVLLGRPKALSDDDSPFQSAGF